MWPDNETSVDLLGFRIHADLVRSVVMDPAQLPVTIGVFADWGGGKSSLMKILQRDLDPETWPDGSPERGAAEKTACLYFNGWLFEGYDDAKAAILSSVLLALGEHKRFGPVVRDKVVSLLKSVNWMRVARMGFKHIAAPAVAAYVTGGTSIVPSLIGAATSALGIPRGRGKEDANLVKSDEWGELIKKDETPAGPLDARSFRERFAEMLRDCKIESLVILIDDLDRCSPERIIENLEAIKLFLNVEHTAFVIGADRRIVRHAIEWRYQQNGNLPDLDAETREQLVKDYLEKLIQIPYRLPRLSPAEIESYMTLLFCQRHLPEPECQLCRDACDLQRSTNRYGVFGYGAVKDALKKEPPRALSEALAFSSASAPLITEGLKGNPRQVKRFLNAYFLRKKLAEIARLTNVRDDVLVKLMILEYAEEKLFTQLFAWQASQNGQPQELVALEAEARKAEGDAGKGERDERPKDAEQRWSGSFARRWLAMDPPLARVDLRDYFWVARDRLESTFSNVSMVPPIVRRAFEGLVSGNAGVAKPALSSVKEFNEDELASLLGLVEQQIKAHPDQKVGFDALRSLVESGIGPAATSLGAVLVDRPLEPMPAAVGMDLIALMKAKPELGPVFGPALERLRKSNSKVGRAVQAAEAAPKRRP